MCSNTIGSSGDNSAEANNSAGEAGEKCDVVGNGKAAVEGGSRAPQAEHRVKQASNDAGGASSGNYIREPAASPFPGALLIHITVSPAEPQPTIEIKGLRAHRLVR